MTRVVRRRAEASLARTAAGARRLAVDATAKDIGRKLECVGCSSASGWKLEEALDKTAADALRRATDRCGVRPPKNK